MVNKIESFGDGPIKMPEEIDIDINDSYKQMNEILNKDNNSLVEIFNFGQRMVITLKKIIDCLESADRVKIKREILKRIFEIISFIEETIITSINRNIEEYRTSVEHKERYITTRDLLKDYCTLIRNYI